MSSSLNEKGWPVLASLWMPSNAGGSSVGDFYPSFFACSGQGTSRPHNINTTCKHTTGDSPWNTRLHSSRNTVASGQRFPLQAEMGVAY